jgi:hypothetical protein
LIQPFQQPERVLGFFNTYWEAKRVTKRTLTEIADQFQYWPLNTNGIVHRDLKPANVKVTPGQAAGFRLGEGIRWPRRGASRPGEFTQAHLRRDPR